MNHAWLRSLNGFVGDASQLQVLVNTTGLDLDRASNMNGVDLSKLSMGSQAVPKCSIDQAEKPLEAHSPGEPCMCLSYEPMELIRRLKAVVSATNDRQPSSCEPGLRRSVAPLVALLERS